MCFFFFLTLSFKPFSLLDIKTNKIKQKTKKNPGGLLFAMIKVLIKILHGLRVSVHVPVSLPETQTEKPKRGLDQYHTYSQPIFFLLCKKGDNRRVNMIQSFCVITLLKPDIVDHKKHVVCIQTYKYLLEHPNLKGVRKKTLNRFMEKTFFNVNRKDGKIGNYSLFLMKIFFCHLID